MRLSSAQTDGGRPSATAAATTNAAPIQAMPASDDEHGRHDADESRKPAAHATHSMPTKESAHREPRHRDELEHSMHTADELAFASPLHVPLVHGCSLDDPAGQYQPARHPLQPVAAGWALHVPAGHL